MPTAPYKPRLATGIDYKNCFMPVAPTLKCMPFAGKRSVRIEFNAAIYKEADLLAQTTLID
jgi:hypothetical protein